MRVIAVAKALQVRGHQVKVLAGEKQVPVIRQHHLDFVLMPPLPQFDFPFAAAGKMDEGRMEEIMASLQEILPQLTEAEKKVVGFELPDVMLCGSFTGPMAAAAFDIPSALVILQPHGRKTVEFMTGRLKEGDRLAGLIQAARLLILEGMPELDGGLGPEVYGEGWAAMKDKIRYTGPLMADPPDGLAGQAELKRRHTGGHDRPLVYATIGGGTPLIGEEFLSLCLAAFRRLPQVKGVIATGLAIDPGRLTGETPPDNVTVRGFVPGTELIKAADVTVFHGGSSTLMTCIACGRPAVVVTSMAEQEDNGAVLAGHGAGIVLEKEGLTARILAEAVQRILGDCSFRNNADRLKELGEKYGGAPAAATMVERLVQGGDGY
jgi:UDP:flavonoid glycosyltransferase YjiC (YdhE family)